jgi:hypothetical protein
MRKIAAKRRAPASVSSVLLDGVSYSKEGMSSIRATRNDEFLWEVKVYEVQYNRYLETDVQDVHINLLQLDQSRENLLVGDEAGRRYFVNIASQSVRQS